MGVFTTDFEHTKHLTATTELVQKSLEIVNRHYVALKSFNENYPGLQYLNENSAAVQSASRHLLEMNGINKNILGVQSILAQNNDLIRTTNAVREAMNLSVMRHSLEMSGIAAVKHSVDLSGIAAVNQETLKYLSDLQKIYSQPSVQSIIRKSNFLHQLASQSPLISAMQSRFSNFESMFENRRILEKTFSSQAFINSALAVTMASLDFSSELEQLDYDKQSEIVSKLDNVDLNNESETVPIDELSEETRNNYITLIKSIRNFLNNIMVNIIGILNTQDFTNPFTVIAFAHYVVSLFLNCLFPPDSQENKDNHNQK